MPYARSFWSLYGGSTSYLAFWWQAPVNSLRPERPQDPQRWTTLLPVSPLAQDTSLTWFTQFFSPALQKPSPPQTLIQLRSCHGQAKLSLPSTPTDQRGQESSASAHLLAAARPERFGLRHEGLPVPRVVIGLMILTQAVPQTKQHLICSYNVLQVLR